MATISLSLIVNSVPSTAVTFTPASPFSGSGSSFTAVGPIAANATIGTFSVAPSGWQGLLALSGAQAADFTLNGMSLVTAAALSDGNTYDVTATATP